LWSLGVVLWEAVTGSRLFRGSNEAATLNMTLSEEVASPSMRRPDLPPELEAILMRALQRVPAERYASAAAMRDDLETWLSGRELLPSASVAQLMRRLFGRELSEQRQQIQGLLHTQPDPSAESGVTMLAPLLGTGITSSGLRATQMSSVTDLMQELTRQRRVTTRLLSGLLLLLAAAMLVGLYLLLQRPAAPSAALPAAAASPLKAASVVTATPEPAAAVETAETARPGRAPTTAKPAPAAALPLAARNRPAPLGSKAAITFDADAPTPTAPAPGRAETGLLNLDTSPWSIVSMGGRVLGQTPLIGASLPVGTHTLVLSNPEQGLKTTYQVTISAGQTTARRIGLD
jgi:serine/threonine-protein kinase